MAEGEPVRPAAVRFAPSRLRAAALREEIEATQAELEATVAALDGEDPVDERSFEQPEPAAQAPREPDEQPEPAAQAPREREPEVASPTVDVGGPALDVPPPRSSRPLAATAITFIAGVGAGLLLRRR